MDANVLMQQGLTRALEEEVARIKKTGIFNLSYEVAGNPIYLEAQQELLIFRIIQETFNNCIKHSNAENCTLQLDYKSDALNIKIYDDGKGFEVEKAKQSMRAGLQNIQNRVNMLGGNMTLHSEPGCGSSLLLYIPYTNYAENKS